MRFFHSLRQWLGGFPLLLSVLNFSWASGLGAVTAPTGLVRTVEGGGSIDHSVADNLWLFVPSGEPATPFVPLGQFTAKWSGSVMADLRGDFNFHVVANGSFQLFINDALVLEVPGTSSDPVSSKSVRLNKGANKLMAKFASPATGDAVVRVYWSNQETPLNPIPFAQLQHANSPELIASMAIRNGRDLFAEFRCAKCHSGSTGMPELSMDAPAFAGMGGRRRFDWLAKWIEDPSALRPDAHMPRIFSGEGSREKAEAVAAYLMSLKSESLSEAKAGDIELGRSLYDKLHCVACHIPPDGGEAEPGKISQKRVRAKFATGALATFLQNPAEHYAWIRMPNFRLNSKESSALATYLESVGEAPSERVAPPDIEVIQKGQRLVQTSGCLNCHGGNVSNSFTAQDLASLDRESWSRGCLADSPVADSKAPRFVLDAEQRSALRAFGSTDHSSLTRSTDADFLERHSRHLQCRECHGKFEGFPAWDLLPGKFQPEWAAQFIGGRESWKPRPWIEARMPAFGLYAEHLGKGLATAAGFPPVAMADPAPENAGEMAKIGQKLAGPNGGFTCVSCHGIGDFAATQVFEAPGINLAHSGRRLQKSYFQRWLRSPLSVDPTTKMPVYFDEEGRSPLADVLEGDGPKTIGALWEYLRLGANMPKPE